MSTSSPTPDSQQRARRGPRLANDPDRYIRQVPGGYQVRPYCTISKKRHTLPGVFRTPAAARKARDEFWWGKLDDVQKYVRRQRHPDDTFTYKVVITFRAGRFLQEVPRAYRGDDLVTINAGSYPTEAAAVEVRNRILTGLFGEDAPLLVGRYEFARKSTPPPTEDPESAP